VKGRVPPSDSLEGLGCNEADLKDLPAQDGAESGADNDIPATMKRPPGEGKLSAGSAMRAPPTASVASSSERDGDRATERRIITADGDLYPLRTRSRFA
jgi:hypothetical protein